MKETIYNKVDALKDEIVQLSSNIHANPELAFNEYKSAGFIIDMLRSHGFSVEEKSGGLDTAFKARFRVKEGGPTIAYLAEYDALPEIGHACGHNLISAVSVGAAVTLSEIMKENDLPGEVILMGTPAEEGGGGKIILLQQGEFNDVDYALMTHPSTNNLIGRGGLATTKVSISYHGVAAHSASPENGVNALQAVIQTFNLIDSIRARMPNKTNINGIITAGGTATNIIPDFAECKFSVRNATFGDLKVVVNMIKDVVRNIENFLGVTAQVECGLVYSERYPNMAIAETFKKYMEDLGETVNYPDPNAKIGSSDIGNVTLKVPAIHSYIKISDERVVAHNVKFTAASITDRAHAGAIKAAKSLAAAGYEILTDAELRNKIQVEFDAKVPHYDNFDL